MDAVSQPELEQIERIGGADLVLAILEPESGDASGAAVAMAREAIAGLSKVARAVVLCPNGAAGHPSVTSGPSDDEKSPSIFIAGLPSPGATETPPQSWSHAYRSVLAFGGKLGARACGVIASRSQVVTPQWIHRLVQPILDLGFDLVGPRYTRQKMEGLLNTSLLAPLHRALYGEQLQNPMGPDFGLSGKLLERLLGQNGGARRGNESDLLASIASVAGCDGFKICESYLGARAQPPTDWINLSGLLAQILGPVFVEVERQAPAWQRIRGSKPVPRFGFPEAMAGDTPNVDVRRMIESFHLGVQNLQDIWGIVLPPTTLLEVRKLSRLAPDQFRMPDDLWVRIVYDFALGHRLRTISRDHLLRSITPLYVGWIASYALELQAAGPAETEARTERLSRAYETGKPYLVSRWRWPDRFNP